MRRLVLTAAAILSLAAGGALANGFSVSSHHDGGVSITSNSDGDHGDFSVKTATYDIKASWAGDFEFAADGRSLRSLNGIFSIESKGHRFAFSGDGKTMETHYFTGGKERPLDDAARKEAGDLLLTFVRASAFDADERVAALLKKGGVGAVMGEIKTIEFDYSKMRYTEALSDQSKLSDADIKDLAAEIEAFDGDYSKRRAIEALLVDQDLSLQSRARLLKAAEGISSNHDLRLLIEAAAAKNLTPDAVQTAMTLLMKITSDHDFRLGAESLLAQKTLSDADAARIVTKAAAHMKSDHDLGLVVEMACDRARNSDLVAAAAIGAASKIGSDHDRAIAIESISESLPKNSSRWTQLINAASGIGSSHDAAVALQMIADEMPRGNGTLAAYRKAASAIASEHDRDRALSAVE